MPQRRRSPSAQQPTSAGSGAAAGQRAGPAASQGANSELLAQMGGQQADAGGFLDQLLAQQPQEQQQDRQAEPPAPQKVEGPEHQAAVELAVEAAVGPQQRQEQPATAHAPAVETTAERAAPTTARQPQPAQQPAGPQRAASEAAQSPPPDLGATRPGGRGSRPLTEAEIAYARRIYGDSIDYSKVRMTSDHWLSTGAPKAIGNTMHLRSEWGSAMFNEDGTLTGAGHELLIHELGHVWQYQNGGLAYIGDALWAMTKAWASGGDRGGAYDWKAAADQDLPWEKWNPEQQAEAIETYDRLLRAQESGWINDRDRAELERLQPYIDKVRAGEGAPQFSVPGAAAGGLGGAGIGAGIGALVGGPIGAAIGAGIGALVGGWFLGG